VAKKDPSRTDRTEFVPPGPDSADKHPTQEPNCGDHSDGDSTVGEATAADRLSEAGGQVDIEQLQCDLEKAKDRALRSQAELENFRKRAARELSDQRRYADLNLMRDLLPIWDNMNRAIEAAEQSEQATGLLEGFRMVARQLQDALARHHCTEIPALHQPFDPNLHEAISQQPSDVYPAGTVVYVAQAGFQLHDRVVRPSQVIISTTAPETDGDNEDDNKDV